MHQLEEGGRETDPDGASLLTRPIKNAAPVVRHCEVFRASITLL